jgi:hypothetical protein
MIVYMMATAAQIMILPEGCLLIELLVSMMLQVDDDDKGDMEDDDMDNLMNATAWNTQDVTTARDGDKQLPNPDGKQSKSVRVMVSKDGGQWLA